MEYFLVVGKSIPYSSFIPLSSIPYSSLYCIFISKELPTILKVADQLRIRGLATSTEKIAPRNDVLIGSKDEDEDEHRKIIVSTNHNKGRKGYLPKKIRTSGDRTSDNSSPGRSLSDHGASPVPQRRNR